MAGLTALFDRRANGSEALAVLCRMVEAMGTRGKASQRWCLLGPEGAAQVFPKCPSAEAVPRGVPFLGVAWGDHLSDTDLGLTGSPDGRFWIALDGELYNEAELRTQVQDAGQAPGGNTTSELVLACYQTWGMSCFERLNGAWAAVIVDRSEHRLVGARDHLGLRPLYVSLAKDRVACGSDASALALAAPEGRALEQMRFAEFLSGFPPNSTARSFYQAVHQVPPGSSFTVDLRNEWSGDPRFASYWDPGFGGPSPEISFQDAATRFAAGLVASVQERSDDAAALGCLVSGGMDSSVLSGILARETKRDFTAFSLAHEDPGLSEIQHAEAVVEHLGVPHKSVVLTPERAWRAVDDVVLLQGEPLLGQDLIAANQVYQLVADHGVRVVLDGLGADEVLAGPGVERVVLGEALMTGHWRRFWNELSAVAGRKGRSRLRTAAAMLRVAVSRDLADFAPRSYDWLEDDHTVRSARREMARAAAKSTDASLLNRFLYRTVRQRNLPTVLAHLDRCASAHGVTARLPFLDPRLVSFCFSLPGEYKFHDGVAKRLLATMSRQYLPESVADRKDKMAMVSRLNWLRLRDMGREEVKDMMTDGRLGRCEVIQPRALRRFLEGYLAGAHRDDQAVWRLYTSWRWLHLLEVSG